jgi:hypothetical protein
MAGVVISMHAGRTWLRLLETKLQAGIDANPFSGSQSHMLPSCLEYLYSFTKPRHGSPRFASFPACTIKAKLEYAGRLMIGLKIGQMS